MAAVEARKLSWRYRGSSKPVLNEISLQVKEGEFVAITGPSGAGKTTLLLALIGIIPQQLPGEFSGTVRVLGYETTKTDTYRIAREVGVVFEDPEIQFVMSTVEDEILLGLEPLGLTADEVRERIEWSLSIVGLESSFLSRSPIQLSGGEKQRVAIASAIARRPKLLLLDEPTSDLDPKGKEEVVSALRRLRDDYKATIIMVEHEPELIEEFADRLVVVDQGRIVLEGDPHEIYEIEGLETKHAVYPPDYVEVGRRLNLQARRRDEFIKMLTSQENISLNGLCCFKEYKPLSGRPLVSVRDVWFSYSPGVSVLRGVSLDVYPGEMVALMGPNGSGKTTLSKIIAGLLKPSRGDVYIEGRSIKEYTRAELAELVGYVYQNPQHQIFNQTVWDEVAFGWRIRGVSEAAYKRRVEEAIRQFNLEGLEHEHPFFLSKGEKRRLAIASVYTLNPKMLVVDEPTTGQDRRLSDQMLSLFKSLTGEGKTVLVITHSVNLALKYADRLVVMVDGNVIADGAPWQVLRDDAVIRSAHLKQPVVIQACMEVEARRHTHSGSSP
ncbi:MAG: energy-coupling factor transporter ATPase [Infirmifilum sp.]